MKTETKKLWMHSVSASVVAVFLSLFGYALNHTGLNEAVFLFVPFCTGLAIAFMSKGRKIVAITAMTSLLLSVSILVFSGLEGIVCVIMAFPILFLGIGIGAGIGFLIGKKFISQYGNITVIALCVGSMTLVGWTNRKMAKPELLVVTTSMNFHAPMADVWNSVRASGKIEGDDTALRMLGLPVPQSCILSEDGTRVCYFDQGKMVQQVTSDEFGKTLEVDIVESLNLRDWISFIAAGYRFVQKESHVEVIRTDRIESTLRPRWYWRWFEEKCVRIEHKYVMTSMKTKAEQGGTDQLASTPEVKSEREEKPKPESEWRPQ